MAYQRISSDHINAIDYDMDASQLHVKFNDGAEWTYHDVPRDVAEGLLTNPSAGRYFHKMIKTVYRASRRELADSGTDQEEAGDSSDDLTT